MSKIRIRNGPYTNREVTLAEAAVTIGRDAEAGLPILDRSASRFHAEVVPVGGMYFVRDLDSKNGTFINDDKLEDEELLREGDVIKIGTTELVFESGVALTDSDSGQQVAYDDELRLTNTIEFRVDDLSDLEDEDDAKDDGQSLRILYQIGKTLGGSSADPCSKTLDLLIAALPADHAIVLIRQGSSSKLTPKYIRSKEQWSKPVIARSIIKSVITENRAVLTENAQEDQRFNRRNSIVSGNVRSVVCVPLGGKSKVRGVLYISRSGGSDPFSHDDLELLSACAIQLGMYFNTQDQIQKQQSVLWQSINSMVHIMEMSHNCVGRGNRCARTALAIASKLHVSERSQLNIRLAAALHHIGSLSTNDDTLHLNESLALLEGISGFKTITPLIKNAFERLDGSGPNGVTDSDLDLETRIINVAVAFEHKTSGNYDVDVMAVINELESAENLDPDIIIALREAHLDGSLYHGSQAQAEAKPESSESEEA